MSTQRGQGHTSWAHFDLVLEPADRAYLAVLLRTRVLPPGHDLPARAAASTFARPEDLAVVRRIVERASAEYLVDLTDEDFVVYLTLHVRNLIEVITRNDVDWARLDADLVLTTIEPPRPIGGALVIHPFLTEVDVSNIRQFVSRARRSRRRALIRDDLLRFFAPRCCYATSIPAMPRP